MSCYKAVYHKYSVYFHGLLVINFEVSQCQTSECYLNVMFFVLLYIIVGFVKVGCDSVIYGCCYKESDFESGTELVSGHRAWTVKMCLL